MSATGTVGMTKKNYEPSKRLASFHVKGFQHWDGAMVLKDMNAGDKLELVSEFDNPYDPQAIAVYFGDSKLGYVPAEINEMFATMFFFRHADIFEARIMQIDPESDPWTQVRMGIYVKDAR